MALNGLNGTNGNGTHRHQARFAETLIANRLLTEPQLELALLEQRRNGQQLGKLLVQLGFVSAEKLADCLARETDTRAVNLNRMPIDQEVVKLVPIEWAKRFCAMPIARTEDSLTVALADPYDVVAIDGLRQVTGLHIDIVTAPETDILSCQELYYTAGITIEQSIDEILDAKLAEEARPLEEILADMGDKPDDAPVIRLVSQVITRAVTSGASDIHFEPEERMMRIRTRIDGVLHQELLIPKAMQSAVSTRMKILADLDVAETRIPQDGRATILVGGRQIYLRVSSLPTCHGENIVSRILDPGSQILTFPALGFLPEAENQFRELMNKPYGVVLVTGPTGSGKTTTLYTALREVATMDVSTFTLEDPIEYRMPILRQTQVKEEVGLTFSAGLRALLRQDPDIILVGETRDTETAQLMIRAALTGHLVFSTLHTNDSAGAMPRLMDMGVDPYLLPAALLGILAQRLVRRICPTCKEEVKNPERVFEMMGLQPAPGLPVKLYKGAGCVECKNSGYRGRSGIHELMVIDERFHDPIMKRAGAPEYLRLAREKGMRTMFEDGIVKAMMGATTLEELFKATHLG
jgi:type IV pilus assembly protein PilB